MVEFRDIPDFPGYRAGDDGSIWSAWRKVKLSGSWGGTRSEIADTWKQLKTDPRSNGYLHISLMQNRISLSKSVHVLVCTAFHGPCPEGMEVNHRDNNPANNTVSNLFWGTKRQNNQHKIDMDRQAKGETNGNAKLTEDDVVTIRRECANNVCKKILADRFGVNVTTIYCIAVSKTWKHLPSVQQLRESST